MAANHPASPPWSYGRTCGGWVTSKGRGEHPPWSSRQLSCWPSAYIWAEWRGPRPTCTWSGSLPRCTVRQRPRRGSMRRNMVTSRSVPTPRLMERPWAGGGTVVIFKIILIRLQQACNENTRTDLHTASLSNNSTFPQIVEPPRIFVISCETTKNEKRFSI